MLCVVCACALNPEATVDYTVFVLEGLRAFGCCWVRSRIKLNEIDLKQIDEIDEMHLVYLIYLICWNSYQDQYNSCHLHKKPNHCDHSHQLFIQR
jgi:hypothetical protein